MTSSLAEKDLLSAVNLRLKPEGFNGVYGCMLEIQSDKTSHQLRYKQRFESIEGKYQNKHVFRITRFDEVFINDKKPDGLLQTLAHDVSKVLYPLEVECRLTGGFIKVSNFKDIKKRWANKKKALLEIYQNKDAIKYIELTDRSFAVEENFQKKMESNYFLALYFKPIFQYYTAICSFENTITFPLLGTAKPVRFKVQQSIDEQALYQNKYRVYLVGQIADDRSLTDLEQRLNFPNYPAEEPEKKGTCDIMYMLNDQTRIIEGIDSVFEPNFGPVRKLKVKMFLLD